MTDGLAVREAGPDDLETVLALTRQDSQHSYDEPDHVTDRQRSALAEIAPKHSAALRAGRCPHADPNQQLLVGELDGRVVATVQVTLMRMLSADGGLYCQVEAVRTQAALRGEGIGRRLMAHVEDEARRRGAARIQLTSNRVRTDAHRFYERLGYEASHVGMKKYP